MIVPNFLQRIFKNISNIPLEHILENVSIKSNNGINLTDIDIKKNCYYPTLHNIKSLLCNGNVLIAGLILDSPLCVNVLHQKVIQLITDIVLIVGYSPNGIFIKTSWTPEILELPIEYISNFKEMWDIYINSPEDKYICQE